MRRTHELNQSLLNRSAIFPQDRFTQNHLGEPDIRRLKRKILMELPERKINKDKPLLEGMFCGKVFNPTSKFILGWHVVIILLIYVYFIQIPIVVAFDDPISQNEIFFYSINIPVIFLFLVDIVINLNTGFYEDGQLQVDPAKIKVHYLKQNLAYDVLSLAAIFFFQLGYILKEVDKNNQHLRYVFIVFFLRLKKVAKLQKRVMLSFDLNRRSKAAFKLLLLLVKILFVCNLVACGGFMLSSYLIDNIEIINIDGSVCKECFWIVATKQGDRSLKDCPFNVRYIYALYWASTTMISIGYGDITPKNSYEVTFTVIIQFLSCLLYAYAINQIWNNMLELNKKKNRINSRLNTINLYMRDKGIGPDLTSKINGYLTNYYYAKNLREKQLQSQIMGQLTPALKKQLFYDSYEVLFKYQYFLSIIQKVKVSACQNVKQVCCYEDESLSPRDFSASPCMYFIKKGQLKQQFGFSKLPIKTQYKGDHVGVYEFITQLGYLSQLTAIQYTLAYYIKYCFWRAALLEDRGCFQYFYLTKQSLILYNQFNRIGYKCFFCSLQNHRTQLCFHYKLRRQVNKFYQSFRKSQDQYRKSHFMRRKFTIKIGEKKLRKKSFCRVNEFSPKREHYHHGSLLLQMDLLEDSTYRRKWSITEQSDVRRGGKFFVKPKQKHQTHMLLTVREHYANKSQHSQDFQILSEQIRLKEINIDVLALYQEYYPKFNCSELNPRQISRRRITKSFYF